MQSVIKQFDPSVYGRWKGSGLFWDRATGEAINMQEHVVLLNGGLIIPGKDDEPGRIIGGDTPGPAVEVTVGIRTDYYFQLGVQVYQGQDPIDVEPWGWAARATTIKVYDLIRPYITSVGGRLVGIDAIEANQTFKYTVLQDHIYMVFDEAMNFHVPAGGIAYALAGKVIYNNQTDQVNEGTGQDQTLTMLAQEYARAAKAANA